MGGGAFFGSFMKGYMGAKAQKLEERVQQYEGLMKLANEYAGVIQQLGGTETTTEEQQIIKDKALAEMQKILSDAAKLTGDKHNKDLFGLIGQFFRGGGKDKEGEAGGGAATATPAGLEGLTGPPPSAAQGAAPAPGEAAAPGMAAVAQARRTAFPLYTEVEANRLRAQMDVKKELLDEDIEPYETAKKAMVDYVMGRRREGKDFTERDAQYDSEFQRLKNEAQQQALYLQSAHGVTVPFANDVEDLLTYKPQRVPVQYHGQTLQLLPDDARVMYAAIDSETQNKNRNLYELLLNKEARGVALTEAEKATKRILDPLFEEEKTEVQAIKNEKEGRTWAEAYEILRKRKLDESKQLAEDAAKIQNKYSAQILQAESPEGERYYYQTTGVKEGPITNEAGETVLRPDYYRSGSSSGEQPWLKTYQGGEVFYPSIALMEWQKGTLTPYQLAFIIQNYLDEYSDDPAMQQLYEIHKLNLQNNLSNLKPSTPAPE